MACSSFFLAAGITENKEKQNYQRKGFSHYLTFFTISVNNRNLSIKIKFIIFIT